MNRTPRPAHGTTAVPAYGDVAAPAGDERATARSLVSRAAVSAGAAPAAGGMDPLALFVARLRPDLVLPRPSAA